MIVEAMENFARFNGPWLQAWNDMNAASVASTRIAFGQFELATVTSRFLTQRIRAYADYDGRIEPLVRRLDELTEQYTDSYASQVRAIYSSWSDILREDHARELRQIYSAWSDLLREDRAASQAIPMPLPLGGDRRDQAFNGTGDERASGDERGRGSERGKKRSERRPENPAH
jgi:hypothetical protein